MKTTKTCGVCCGPNENEKAPFCSRKCLQRFVDECLGRYGMEIMEQMTWPREIVTPPNEEPPFKERPWPFSDAEFLRDCGIAPYQGEPGLEANARDC